MKNMYFTCTPTNYLPISLTIQNISIIFAIVESDYFLFEVCTFITQHILYETFYKSYYFIRILKNNTIITMKKGIYTLIMLLFVLIFSVQSTRAQGSNNKREYSVNLSVREKGTQESVMMATVSMKPLEAITVTDVDGKATIHNVPYGNYTIEISYVGFEKFTTTVLVNKNLNLNIQLTPTSLALKEVVVTAKQKSSGASTTTLIERQAIDHLQATSLADVMQLIPGMKMGNTDMTQQSNLQLRSLTNNNTNAFGSSIIVDGVPMDNNGTMTQGGFSSTAFVGTDLRNVAADNIENVEVIRGIPSAEYGDLTSGLVIVKSKVGVTPWQFKGKINPEMQNYSLGKGFNLRKAGILNFNFDYAKAWGDPRQKTRSFGRYTFNLGYGYDITRKWHTDTKFRMLYSNDWNGKDPDAIADGTESKNTNYTFGLTHNGRISIDKLLMRTLNYTLGVTMSKIDNKQSSFVTNSSGLLPILTARETGYYPVGWMTQSYLATGKTESRPGNLFAKINDSFFFTSGKIRQSFKAGLDYRMSWNSGKGYFNEDDRKPLRPNSNGRPRAFNDIPTLHQLAFYAEDNFAWNINKINKLMVNFGLRFTTQQPFSDVATSALSPRLNASFSVTKWLDIRGGIGLNSKTPGLDYLYPDKKYDDRVAVNYMPQGEDKKEDQRLIYHTQVYDVQRSKNLKNATTTKVEFGIDIKLPGNRILNILAYHDKTPNGFGPATQYFVYQSNYYKDAKVTNGNIEYGDPRVDNVFMTTGAIGNTNTTVNKGIEFNFDFGSIKPLNTKLLFSGAYSETKTWSTDMLSTNAKHAYITPDFNARNTTPFKVVYPSALDYDKYRRFINTLQIVTNIPRLRMVASFTAQAIWYDYNYSFTATKNAIAYITPDLTYHEISESMQNGYLDMKGNYYAEKPNTPTVKISDLAIDGSNSVPTKNPITWNIQGRLTKELGKIGGLSLYVNNVSYYEPYLKTNTSNSLVQRNTNSFSYGVELNFKL
jgi:hypothetical protein